MNSRRLLIICLFLAVVVRLVMMFCYPVIDHPDSNTFIQRTQQLFNGEGTDGYRGPAYLFFLGTFYKLGLSNKFILATQHLLGILSTLLLFLTARRFISAGWAFWITLFYTLSLLLFTTEHTIISEGLFAPLVILSLYLGTHPKYYLPSNTALLALVHSLATLTRHVFFAFQMTFPFLILLCWKMPLRKKLIHLSVFTAVSAAAILPWGFYLQSQLGFFTLGPIAGSNIPIKVVNLIHKNTSTNPYWKKVALQTMREQGWGRYGWPWRTESEKNNAMLAINEAFMKRGHPRWQANAIMTSMAVDVIISDPWGYLKNVLLAMYNGLFRLLTSGNVFGLFLIVAMFVRKSHLSLGKGIEYVALNFLSLFVVTYTFEEDVDRYILAFNASFNILAIGLAIKLGQLRRKRRCAA